MACTIDLPTLPTLPAGLTLSPPALPSISVGLDFCCKLPSFSLSLPIPIPALTINPTFLATVNTVLQAVNTYLDQIPIPCPREG